MQHLEESKLQQLKLVKDERQKQKLPSSTSLRLVLVTPAQAKGSSVGAAPASLGRKMKEKHKGRNMSGKKVDPGCEGSKWQGLRSKLILKNR